MGETYYNPNQTTVRPGRNYEATKPYYDQQALQPSRPQPGTGTGVGRRLGDTVPMDRNRINPNAMNQGQQFGQVRGQLKGQYQNPQQPQPGGVFNGRYGSQGVATPQGINPKDWRGGYAGGPAGGPHGPVGGPMDELANTMRAAPMPKAPIGSAMGQSGINSLASMMSGSGVNPEYADLAQQYQPTRLTQRSSKPKYTPEDRADAWERAKAMAESGVPVGDVETLLDEYGYDPADKSKGGQQADELLYREVLGNTRPKRPVDDFDVDVGTIETSGAYQDDIQTLLDSINTDYSNQEAHALSQLNNQKQGSINDLAGVMGARGVGSSPATMYAGLGDLEAAYAGQGAEVVSDIQQRQTDAKLQQLATLGQIAESTGNLDLKAQVEDAALSIKEEQLSSDLESTDLERKQGVVDSFLTTVANIREALNVSTVNSEDRIAFEGALTAIANAMNDPNVTAAQLQALYMDLIAQWGGFILEENENQAETPTAEG